MGQITEINNKCLEHIQIRKILNWKKKLKVKEKSKLSDFYCKYICITVKHSQIYVSDEILLYLIVLKKTTKWQ